MSESEPDAPQIEPEPEAESPSALRPRLMSVDRDELVSSVFEALLGRRPDAEALEAYGDALSHHGLTVGDFVRDVVESAESRGARALIGARVFAKLLPEILEETDPGDGDTETEPAALVRRTLSEPDVLRAMMRFAFRRQSMAELFLAEHDVRGA